MVRSVGDRGMEAVLYLARAAAEVAVTRRDALRTTAISKGWALT
jgi:hypothetical protein